MKSIKYIFIVLLLGGSLVMAASVPQRAASSDANTARPRVVLPDANATKPAISALGFEEDIVKTNAGDLKITCIGHGTLMFEFAGKVIHVDPVTSAKADYTKLPKADIILITHEHGDHFDVKAIDILKKPQTQVILTQTCAQKYKEGQVMKNGDTKTIDNIKIEAVPAYNLVQKFHPKGQGNGYVLTFGDKKVYVAGDTELIPEMKELKDIYIAFLPVNLPYTMTPEMASEAAKLIKPKIFYPYHFGQTDTKKIVDLLKDSGIEVRIRKME